MIGIQDDGFAVEMFLDDLICIGGPWQYERQLIPILQSSSSKPLVELERWRELGNWEFHAEDLRDYDLVESLLGVNVSRAQVLPVAIPDMRLDVIYAVKDRRVFLGDDERWLSASGFEIGVKDWQE